MMVPHQRQTRILQKYGRGDLLLLSLLFLILIEQHLLHLLLIGLNDPYKGGSSNVTNVTGITSITIEF